MLLYHYYDKTVGPFRSISELTDEEAERLLAEIKVSKPRSMCAGRQEEYLTIRRRVEGIMKHRFLIKGGRVERDTPHYLVVGECRWLGEWYENCGVIKIDMSALDPGTVSFTYGDSHPTFGGRINDGKEYRNKIYTYDEIPAIIEKYGLPQFHNADGRYGPERYVEAQVWSDRGIIGGPV